jgi:hypothetical protein
MNLIKNIAESTFWDSHKDSIFFIFIFVLFPSFLPVWITLFAMFLTDNWANVADLVTNGAFFIYSAALLSAAIEKMDGTYKKDTVSFKRFLYHCSIILILLSTVGFVIAIAPSIFGVGNSGTSAVYVTAFVFVLLSLAILYYAHFTSKSNINPEKESMDRVKDLMSKLS